MKEFICHFCLKDSSREYHSSNNKSGKHFCSRECREADKRGFALNKELQDDLIELREQGFTIHQVAEITGISSDTYYKVMKTKY